MIPPRVVTIAPDRTGWRWDVADDSGWACRLPSPPWEFRPALGGAKTEEKARSAARDALADIAAAEAVAAFDAAYSKRAGASVKVVIP